MSYRSTLIVGGIIVLAFTCALFITVTSLDKPMRQPVSRFVQAPMHVMSEGVVTVCAKRRQGKVQSWMATSAGELLRISRYKMANTAKIDGELKWSNDMCAIYKAPRVSSRQIVRISAWEDGRVIAEDSFFVFPEDKF